MNTFHEIFIFYRSLGFFAEYGSSRELAEAFEEEQGEAPDPASRWLDVFLLGHDTRRVWQDDPEADVCRENRVYTEVLPEWGRVSRGVFSPTNLEETWESEKGPITVSFTLDGRPCLLHPGYLDDWLDLGILSSINQEIEASGQRFECFVDGNHAIVFAVNAEERRQLEETRAFPFV